MRQDFILTSGLQVFLDDHLLFPQMRIFYMFDRRSIKRNNQNEGQFKFLPCSQKLVTDDDIDRSI